MENKKQSKLFYISLITFFILIIIYIIYNSFILNFYRCDYFKLDFDKKWTSAIKDDNYIKLKDKNNSTVQIIGKKIPKEEQEKELSEIYYDYEEEFKQENKNFELVNYGNTKVGKNYLDANEYFYEYKDRSIQLILIIKDDTIIEISYSSVNQLFDIDAENFYDILNSLEI